LDDLRCNFSADRIILIMTDARPKTSTTPKSQVFLRRFVSSASLWTLVLWALFTQRNVVAEFVFLGVILTLAVLGLREFYSLMRRRNLACFEGWGIFGGVLLTGCTFFYLSGRWGKVVLPSKANDFETSFVILFVLGLCVRQFLSRGNQSGLLAISTTLFGLMYVPWLLNFIQKIAFFPNVDGRFYVLYFLVVTKFSDIGAYVVGTLIGRHKMIPRISPGKTWEGLGGAIFFSTAGSLLFAHWAHHRLTGMNYGHAILLGVLLSLTAVLGDLIESLFKREAGVKDSGQLFPGIGGILDLIDSVLFNAPLLYLYLRHILT
jgi:phosphatidate cytidylyltransferase